MSGDERRYRYITATWASVYDEPQQRGGQTNQQKSLSVQQKFPPASLDNDQAVLHAPFVALAVVIYRHVCSPLHDPHIETHGAVRGAVPYRNQSAYGRSLKIKLRKRSNKYTRDNKHKRFIELARAARRRER
ncbi:MAG: hypothetical protein IV085_06465 [Thiobacillus sp.]|nr:hypothetical protein [Thiobacillus sp.]